MINYKFSLSYILPTLLLHACKQEECSGMCEKKNNILGLKRGKNHKRKGIVSFDITVKKDMIEDRPLFGTSICSHLTRTCQVLTIKMCIVCSTLTNKVIIQVQIMRKLRVDKLDQSS